MISNIVGMQLRSDLRSEALAESNIPLVDRINTILNKASCIPLKHHEMDILLCMLSEGKYNDALMWVSAG